MNFKEYLKKEGMLIPLTMMLAPLATSAASLKKEDVKKFLTESHLKNLFFRYAPKKEETREIITEPRSQNEK